VFVLDVDCYKPAGAEWLASQDEVLATVPYVTTRNGGRHYFYRWECEEQANGKVCPGVDLRGEGGYVVFYGSWPTDTAQLPTMPEIWWQHEQRSHDETWAPADYGDVDWAGLLEPHGWYRNGQFWVHPESSNHRTATITTHGNLYMHGTTCHPFESGESYTPWKAHELLNPAQRNPYARHEADPGPGEGAWEALMASEDLWERPPMAPETATERVITTNRGLIDGETFVFEIPAGVPAVWGDGDLVAWPSGEPLLIVGPAGVGKTTIAQQITLALCGISTHVLGMPVVQHFEKVLYIAADRPRQAQRSLSRMVTDDHRELLRNRLVVWRGPLEKDLVADPEQLVRLCDKTGVQAIIIDSLKDIALDLSKDETGGRVNRALQLVVSEGIELGALHHQRKSMNGHIVKPKALDDVYGSTWITAGAGSVILVWGEPGDPEVEISHLKQPAGDIGPFKVMHSHLAGHSEVSGAIDLLAMARRDHRGLTAQALATVLFSVNAPTPKQVEKARRKLEDAVTRGALVRIDGAKGGGDVRSPTRYHPAAEDQDVSDVFQSRKPITEQSQSITEQSRKPTTGVITPPLRGGRRSNHNRPVVPAGSVIDEEPPWWSDES
jgi:replicative DNA helicase